MLGTLTEQLSPDYSVTRPQHVLDIEADWSEWVRTYFRPYVTDDSGEYIPFGEHHARLWEWVWSIERGKRPHPFIAIWPRGHAKSTSAEMAVVALGALDLRSYVLYVCQTQDQADDHVANIAAMLESEEIGRAYPGLSEPKVGKHGNSKGWRRNRLRTASGLTVDAIGLDSAARGAKVDEDRPDAMVIDDVDGELDTPKTTEKKIKSLTRKLLPAGATDLAVLAVQNLVHNNSIFSRLSDSRADFLADRIVDGPLPALRNMQYEEREGRAVITAGEPTWEGMDLPRCQEVLDDEGLTSFLVERQQEREAADSAFNREWFIERYDPTDTRFKNRSVARWIAWDTAAKAGERNAFSACVVGELTTDYRLAIRYVAQDKKTFDALPDYVQDEVHPFVRDGKLRTVVIEDKSSGEELIPVLQTSGPAWIQNLVYPAQAMGKEPSYNAAAVWCRRGMVLLPEPDDSVPWLNEFEEQLFNVPHSEFKDMADAFALVVNHVEAEHGAFSERWNRMLGSQKKAG